MSELKHRTVEANGIRQHLVEQGAGRWFSFVTDFPRAGIPGAIS